MNILQALYTQIINPKYPFDLIYIEERVGYMSILECFLMLIVDMVVYFLLAIYLDNVIQMEYGSAKSCFFFLSPSYWSDSRKDTSNDYTFETRKYIQNDIELQDETNHEIMPEDFNDKIGLTLEIIYNFICNTKSKIYILELKIQLNHLLMKKKKKIMHQII